MNDVGFWGGTESAQPRNRHKAKTNETSKNWIVVTLFSTLSNLQPMRVTQRFPVSGTPHIAKPPGWGAFRVWAYESKAQHA